jgi:hypothetical protein
MTDDCAIGIDFSKFSTAIKIGNAGSLVSAGQAGGCIFALAALCPLAGI